MLHCFEMQAKTSLPILAVSSRICNHAHAFAKMDAWASVTEAASVSRVEM